jgi:hypothetical protein
MPFYVETRPPVAPGVATRNNIARIEVLLDTKSRRINPRAAPGYDTLEDAQRNIAKLTGLTAQNAFGIDTGWWAEGAAGRPLIWVRARWSARVRPALWKEDPEIVAQGVAESLGWARARFRLAGAHDGRGPDKPWVV